MKPLYKLSKRELLEELFAADSAFLHTFKLKDSSPALRRQARLYLNLVIQEVEKRSRSKHVSNV